MAYWSKQVEACRSSGLTVAQWCSENNVAVSTYYSWQRKLFQNLVVPTDVCFAELPTAVSFKLYLYTVENGGIDDCLMVALDIVLRTLAFVDLRFFRKVVHGVGLFQEWGA